LKAAFAGLVGGRADVHVDVVSLTEDSGEVVARLRSNGGRRQWTSAGWWRTGGGRLAEHWDDLGPAVLERR
jgi:predicted SnoaL-like aldol condensation-catalyzing enzyme